MRGQALLALGRLKWHISVLKNIVTLAAIWGAVGAQCVRKSVPEVPDGL